MIKWTNLFSKVDHQKKQSFFASSEDLQFTIDALLNEAQRYNYEISEAEKNGEAERIKVQKEYLSIVNQKIDKFLKDHPEAENYINRDL